MDPLSIIGSIARVNNEEVLVEKFQEFCGWFHPENGNGRRPREGEQPCGEPIYAVVLPNGHSRGGYHARFLIPVA